MLTTPSSPVDISAHFAWLREFAATGIRLHPRRTANLPVHVSKMGGLFYWPRAVPWPVCHARDAEDLYDLSRPEKMDELRLFLAHTYELARHDGLAGDSASAEPIHRWISRQMDEVHELARRGRRGHGQPFLPLLQLQREEFPTLPFPRGTDLFQLLWCPHVHFAGPPDEPPGFLAFWRRQVDITEPLLVEPPMPEGVELFECRLHAEYITEYPVSDSFEAHFRADLDHLLTSVAQQQAPAEVLYQTGGAAFYDQMLSAAPGVKLFGYPRWVTEVATPVCICGRRMAILVSIDVDEAAAIGRWRPVEEQEWQPSHGFSIGETGALFLFHCPICPGPRLQALVQTT